MVIISIQQGAAYKGKGCTRRFDQAQKLCGASAKSKPGAKYRYVADIGFHNTANNSVFFSQAELVIEVVL